MSAKRVPFTPGPWHLAGTGDVGRVIETDDKKYFIAEVYSFNGEANASVLLSAPQGYELAKLVVAWNGGGTDGRMWAELGELARQIIEKVEKP